ncbi:MAG TPA: 2-oxoglutarate dehydrogenase complex dihydrolipoyllysine-residue succinyltransferase [Acidobacteriota bacterium]|nr:2-oxoglutarate dehydrogenase complex dihydrolipoyllysine-residue succinyltransferase [Acidobacteriota bacterium]
MVEVKVPEVGESITEGVLAAWLVADGDYVEMDAELFELETDKVTVTINAETAGRIELLCKEEEDVEVGQVVAKIDDSAEKGQGDQEKEAGQEEAGKEEAEKEKEEPEEEEAAEEEDSGQEDQPSGQETDEEERPGPKPVEDRPAAASGRDSGSRQLFVPPSVRRMIREHGIDPDQIESSGDRLSKSDVIRHLNLLRSQEAPKADSAAQEPAPQAGRPALEPRPPGEKGRQTRSKMSSLRKRIAERLVQAQKSAAILTTFNEADLSNLMAWRERHKKPFEEKYGVKLGFMSFFVKAAVDALKTVPEVNRQIEGEEIVENHYYDIGIAVSSERGLVVPVLREADRLSFAEVETEIAELARKVREKKISLEELSGGVFTISNGGVFGSLLSTPILNPPQSGVLGMHSIQRRPVAVGDSVEVRPMMYLAMSYDHRIIDGREAVTFLKRICQCVEDPERMMLET